MNKYAYDLEAIKNKAKQYTVFLIVLIILMVALLLFKRLYIEHMISKYSPEVSENELGEIQDTKKTKEVKLNKSYTKGNLAGNRQSNFEQGNSALASIANSKSQLAFHDNIVFRSRLIGQEYYISIEDENNKEILFENSSNNANKFLTALDGYYIFVRVTTKGDRLMSIDNKFSSINDITPSVISGSKRIISLAADGNSLYFTDGISLYTSTLYGEETKTLTSTSTGARIVNIKDNKIFLDDGYTLYSFDLNKKQQDVLVNHNYSPLITWHKDNILMFDVKGKRDLKVLNNNGESVKNTEGINAFNFYQDTIYASVGKQLFNLNAGDLVLEANQNIVSVYISNNYIYVYDLVGEEYKFKI